jgi:hypothetical protein
MSTPDMGNPTNLDPNQTATGLDRALALDFHWTTVLLSPYDITGIAYRIRYRIVGNPTWTTTSTQTVSPPFVPPPGHHGPMVQEFLHTFASNFFAAGSYEWQVQIDDNNGGTTDWSASAFFIAATSAQVPTITAPAAGATLTGGTTNLTWTQTTQSQYRVRVRTSSSLVDDTNVEYDSGSIAATVTRAHTTPVPNPGARWITLQTQTAVGGPWSAEQTRNVTAAGVQPAVPTLTSPTTTDDASCGVRHCVSVPTTNPTPSGGQPTVDHVDYYMRKVGSTDAVGSLVGTLVLGTGSGTFKYPRIPGGAWQVRAVAVVVDGRNATSAWTTLTLQPNITGTVISDAEDPTLAVWFPYNDTGTGESVEIPTEHLQYVGRKSPVVEYADVVESRTVENAKVSILNEEVAKLDMLKALYRARKPVVFRDKNGRRIIGSLAPLGINDRGWGWEVSIAVTETDYPDALVIL